MLSEEIFASLEKVYTDYDNAQTFVPDSTAFPGITSSGSSTGWQSIVSQAAVPFFVLLLF
jgi:hypothetical protein